jgi:hypothetical protein
LDSGAFRRSTSRPGCVDAIAAGERSVLAHQDVHTTDYALDLVKSTYSISSATVAADRHLTPPFGRHLLGPTTTAWDVMTR